MPELIAKSALAGQGPLTLVDTTLAEVDPGAITSVALFPGPVSYTHLDGYKRQAHG